LVQGKFKVRAHSKFAKNTIDDRIARQHPPASAGSRSLRDRFP
jgi:hypothetical protein